MICVDTPFVCVLCTSAASAVFFLCITYSTGCGELLLKKFSPLIHPPDRWKRGDQAVKEERGERGKGECAGEKKTEDEVLPAGKKSMRSNAVMLTQSAVATALPSPSLSHPWFFRK